MVLYEAKAGLDLAIVVQAGPRFWIVLLQPSKVLGLQVCAATPSRKEKQGYKSQ